jgi:polar amino acid transport system ATP-binding protein
MTPLLQIQDVSISLGGKQILRSVSFDLHKGDLKVLIGPSGGGKSTLLQCINFLLPPDSGIISLEGTPVHGKNRLELNLYRQQVGMIFQDFNLFDHLNALDNVSIALRKVKKFSRKEARERAVAELERVGLQDKVDLFPAELSGGQKQRVSIARALAMDPKVILLDEPTSALDPELVGEVLAVIRSLAQGGMTMLMATHQMSFTRNLADEVLFMQNGELIEQGTPEDLLAPGTGSRTLDFCSTLQD